MANLRQDRVSDATLEDASMSTAEGSTANGSGPCPRSIVLALRLRTYDGGGLQGDVSWDTGSPVVALCMDVISASGGAADAPQGTVLPSRFFDLQSALLTIRRLQWALEGLREGAGSPEITASIAIHSVSDPAAGAVASVLEKSAPGQVLVGGSLAEAVQQLPNADVRGTSAGDWRELLWRTREAGTGFSADEESVLGLIRALGREDPGAGQRETPRTTATAPAFPAAEVSETLGRSRLEPEPTPFFVRMKWLIVGGAVVVVVLLAAWIIPGMVSGNRGKSAPPSPDVSRKTVTPVAPPPPPAPAKPAVSEKPREARQLPRSTKQPKTEAKAEPKTEPVAPKVPAGTCDLTEADIPRSLNRAESYMYAGKLAEAQAMYQRVLGCPSAHDKAQEGLQRVRQRMAAQSP